MNNVIEKSIKMGEEKGKVETYASLVDDGILTIEEAAKRMNMTVKQFKEKVSEAKVEIIGPFFLSVGESVVIDDFGVNINAAEKKALSYSIRNISDSSVADISVSDGKIRIGALKSGKMDFELVVSDGINEVSKMINFFIVTPPAKQKKMLSDIPVPISISTRRLHTSLESPKLEVDADGSGNFVTVDLGNFFDMKAQFKKSNKITMHQLIKKMIDEESSFRTDLDPVAVDYALRCEALKKIVITGDRSSKKPDVIKCQSDDVGLSDGVLCNYGRKITKSISNSKERETLTFCIGGKKDGAEFTKMRVIFTYGS